jgi:vitamin B12 transporter
MLAGPGATAQATTTTAPVVVSATRTAQTVDETLAPVSVITREDIRRLQARSVNDLLRGLPGVTFSNNGGRGQVTSLFLRGAESDQVLVLIDGVKVGSATAGTFTFQDLPVEQVERIELVRGPRASLYGSEAIGGVLQIFTRRGEGEVKPSAQITVGSRGTVESSLGVGGSTDQAWFNVSASTTATRGINSCAGSLVAGCFTIEPDRDAFRNRSAALRGGYRFDNGFEVEAHALLNRSYVQFDGGFQNQSETHQEIYGGTLRYSPAESWDTSLSVGRSNDTIDAFLDAAFASAFITRRDSASWQNDIQIGEVGLLVLGLDYQRDRVAGSTAFVETSRDNKAGFAQYLGGYGDHDIELSLRRDQNEQFGGNTTGAAAWGWRIAAPLRLVLSYGTAFKAPTFNELYFPGFGNPDLRPEESRTLDVGLRGDFDLVRVGLNLFESRVDDLIGFDPVTFTPGNISEARIRGAELTLAARVLGTDISASFTALDPRNRDDGANRDNILPRRARRSVRLDVDRAFGAFAVGGSLVAEGARFDDPANAVRLGGYGTVDLRAQYAFHDDWLLQGRIENLLDKRYETAATYNQPGRGAFVTLRYRPR